AGLLVTIALIFSFTSLKKHLAMKQIREIHTQEKNEQEQVKEKETVPDDENDGTEVSAEENQGEVPEDPVREYLSEKVNKAITRFFKNDIKIVAIGDSLTQGVGDEADKGGYVDILENTINQDRN